MTSKDNGPVLIGFGIISGFSLIVYSLHRMRLARKIQDTPRSAIASAAQGTIEISGYSWPMGNTVKNISGKESVYRRLIIEKKVSSGKSSHWEEVFRHVSHSTFLVVDHSGVVMVETNNTEFDCVVSGKTEHWSSLPAAIRDEILILTGGAVTGLSGTAGFFGTPFRVVEQSLVLGSPAYVLGEFTTHGIEQISAPGIADFMRAVAQIETNPKVLKNFDFNRNGQIEFAEERMGAEHFAQIAVNGGGRPSSGATYDLTPCRVAGRFKSAPGRQVFFSDCHQEELLRELKKFNLLRAIGGAALIALSVWYCWIRYFADSYQNW